MRKYQLILTLLAVAMLAGCGRRAVITELSIVPEPTFMVQKEGTFTISNKTKLRFSGLGQNTSTVKYITKSLHKMSFRLSLSGTEDENVIFFSINDTANVEIGEEGYVLEVRPEGVFVSANTEAGLFYAFQTFVQMLPDDIARMRYSRIVLPACTVLDHPRFGWRGSHRDVSRHFFSVKDIKKHLDLMAAYKLNKFHWHLTDDHGWRIEIEKYPELNDIGSWRVDRDDVPWGEAEPPRDGESRSYGGFYTKDEIIEIVSYAADRHIDVIPEIEIPGHCAEVLASLPWLGCQNDDTTYHVEIGPYWPPRAILCGGNDSVLQFLKDVLDEIIPLFPYEYIHIGGDEAMKDNWKRCPLCQARIHALGLRDEEELQSWMITEIEKYLALHGKRIIGWDEILEGGVSDAATVMSWRGADGAVQAARRGNKAIMCPTDYCYYNFYQANPKFQPQAFPAMVTLYKAYSFDPIPEGLTPAQAGCILGGQCNLWAEYINNQKMAEYMLLPRLCAASECLWSTSKDWHRFRAKMVHQRKRLETMGYTCGESSFKPILQVSKADNDMCSVALDWEVEGTQIFYHVEGDTVADDGRGILYTKPFQVPNGTVVQTTSYLNGQMKEEPYRFRILKK